MSRQSCVFFPLCAHRICIKIMRLEFTVSLATIGRQAAFLPVFELVLD